MSMGFCGHITCFSWFGGRVPVTEVKVKLETAISRLNSCDQKEVLENIANLFNEGNSVDQSKEKCKYLEARSPEGRQMFIQAIHDCIGGISGCIINCGKILHKCIESKGIPAIRIILLMRAVVNKMKMILDHCKKSNNIYEGCFCEISADLSFLFKSTYQTQKIVLEILEKMKILECVEEYKYFASVISELLEVVLILKDIDLTALVNSLRSLNRIILDKKQIHDELDIELLFSTICTCLIDKLNYCWSLIKEASTNSQTDSNRGNKVIKIVRFQAGMLLQLVKEYSKSIFGLATESIIQVLILLQNMMPTSHNAKLKGFPLYEDFCSSVLSVLEPIVMELLEDRSFILAIRSLQVKQSGTDPYGKSQQNLSTLLILEAITVGLSKSPDSTCEPWMKELGSFSSNPSIVDLVFRFFEQCVLENLSGVLVSSTVGVGKPVRFVSLYEYTCVRVSAFISTISPALFQNVECCLLRNLLSSTHCWILAGDVLNFIARWASEALCYNLVNYFAHLICASSQCSTEISYRCSQMLRRMFPLLSEANKQQFFCSFHPSKPEFLPIWLSTDINSLDKNMKEKFFKTFIPTSLALLEDCKANGDIKLMILTLKSWENCLIVDESLGFVPPVHRTAVLVVLMEVFSAFKNNECDDIDQDFFCLVLNSICSVTQCMQEKEIEEVLKTIDTLLEHNRSELLQLSCCNLLSASKSFQFSSESEDSCLNCLWRLCSHLLTSSSFYVRLEAMKSLKEFTEVTKYADKIYNCFSESICEVFLNFLSQKCSLQNFTIEEKESKLSLVLQIAQKVLDQSEPANVVENAPSPSYELIDEPSAKRTRTEPQRKIEKEIKSIESDLDAAILQIRNYLEDPERSEAMTAKIRLLAKDIIDLYNETAS